MGWMDYGAFDGTRSVVGFHEHPIESTLMLLWWEIIPTFVLVGYFWHIPRASSTFYRLPYRGIAQANDNFLLFPPLSPLESS